MSLADAVEVTTQVALADEVICPGVQEPNIVSRALQLLRGAGWDAPPVLARIEKRIPIAAGMGGGSADAAAVLRVAQRMGGVSASMVRILAEELGADVPFQLEAGFALATGAGDRLAGSAWPLPEVPPHAVVVVPSDRRLLTADVYAEADRMNLMRDELELAQRHLVIQRLLRRGDALPAELLVNDLEPAAISLCPSIELGLEAARGAGADHAFVCGSGPTVAGLFWGQDGESRADSAVVQLRESFPGACVAVPVGRGYGAPLFV